MLQSHNPFKLQPLAISMNESNRLKIAVISGASHALKYKKENPKANDEEILRQVTRNVHDILSKISED